MSVKILFLSHSFYPHIGGIEINSEILAEAFVQAGYLVTLATWSMDLETKTFPFTVVRKPSMKALFKMHMWADVVFENNPSLRLAWPSWFYRKASVVVLNTWISRINGDSGWQDKLKMYWLKRATAVIAVSEALQNRCWPAAVVIGNPYREQTFRKLPQITRSKDFVFLGRLVSDKGAKLTIKALFRLVSIKTSGKQVFPDVSLTIVGDGPEKKMLEDMAKAFGLLDHVHFTGALRGQELVSCLNEHRFILVPSIWEEPFGNVALEGMACGCIPIVSDGGGLPEAVGQAGLIFKRGNMDDLMNCIHSIIDNPVLEKTLRERCENHLIEHYSTTVSQRYLQVIQKAIESKNRPEKLKTQPVITAVQHT